MRSTLLIVFNLVGGIFLLLGLAYGLKTFWFDQRNPVMLGLGFAILTAMVIAMIVFGNRIIESAANIKVHANKTGRIQLTLDKDYSEAVVFVEFEVSAKPTEVVEYRYSGRLERDKKVVSTIEFTISNLGPGMAPDNAQLQLSTYLKDSNKTELQDLEPGEYILHSNKSDAPENIEIQESIYIYE